jgi:hypothetical protein
VWSSADPLEGINPTVAQIPMFAKVPHGPMSDDATEKEDCGAPICKELSSLWLCKGPEEKAEAIGTSAPMYRGTGHTAGTTRRPKFAAAGGDVESA